MQKCKRCGEVYKDNQVCCPKTLCKEGLEPTNLENEFENIQLTNYENLKSIKTMLTYFTILSVLSAMVWFVKYVVLASSIAKLF